MPLPLMPPSAVQSAVAQGGGALGLTPERSESPLPPKAKQPRLLLGARDSTLGVAQKVMQKGQFMLNKAKKHREQLHLAVDSKSMIQHMLSMSGEASRDIKNREGGARVEIYVRRGATDNMVVRVHAHDCPMGDGFWATVRLPQNFQLRRSTEDWHEQLRAEGKMGLSTSWHARSMIIQHRLGMAK